MTSTSQFHGNRLPVDVKECFAGNRSQLADVFEATTHIGMMRTASVDICVGLHELELPALVTLEILDQAFPNSIPMHKKWDLVVAVKHWHQRHSNHD